MNIFELLLVKNVIGVIKNIRVLCIFNILNSCFFYFLVIENNKKCEVEL